MSNSKRHQSVRSTTIWIKMLLSFVFWKRYGWIVCVNMMETFSFCLTLWLRTKCYLLNFCPCWCRSIICLVSFFSFSLFVLFDQNFFEVGLMNYFVNTFYYKFDSPRGFPFFTFLFENETHYHTVLPNWTTNLNMCRLIFKIVSRTPNN